MYHDRIVIPLADGGRAGVSGSAGLSSLAGLS
jgi:hypothetical protein